MRVNALYALAVRLGIFNMDEYRHAIERMEPRHYLAASYYERSLTSLATLLRREGRGHARGARAARRRARSRSRWPSAPGRGNAATRERFAPAIACAYAPTTCPATCACPATSAARPASSSASRRAYPFPDAHAHGVAAEDEPTYDVRFRTEELWPSSAEAALVHVGVFQSYLERAPDQ